MAENAPAARGKIKPLIGGLRIGAVLLVAGAGFEPATFGYEGIELRNLNNLGGHGRNPKSLNVNESATHWTLTAPRSFQRVGMVLSA